jgi:hypothetical protein
MNKLNETILRQTIRTILVEDCGCGPVRQGMLHGIGFSTEPHRSSVKVDDHSGRDMDYGDYEGKMVKNNIEIIVGQAKELYDLLQDSDNLPEWSQEKITLAKHNLTSVLQYIESKLTKDV